MKMSSDVKDLFAAIAKVQSNKLNVTKDRNNPITHSKYATLDAIQKVLYPITSKNDLSVTQFPISEDNKVGVQTLVGHKTGQWILYDPFLLSVGGNKRMSEAQEEGSTLTYAKRYQLSAIFGISTDEDTDGNQTSTSTSNQQPRSSGNQRPASSKTDPNAKAKQDLKVRLKAISTEMKVAEKKLLVNAAEKAKVKDLSHMTKTDINALDHELSTELMEFRQSQKKQEDKTAEAGDDFLDDLEV